MAALFPFVNLLNRDPNESNEIYRCDYAPCVKSNLLDDGIGRMLTRIVARIQVFATQRTDCVYLCDVLTGFCPVEVIRIAGQNDDATGRIRGHFVAVEPIAEADVENAGRASWQASSNCSGHRSRLPVGSSAPIQTIRAVRCHTRPSIAASSSKPAAP